MPTPLELVQTTYACFGRGDVPALLDLVADTVTWQFHGDRAAPYTGTVRGKAQLAEWFGSVAAADDVQLFEPREFLVGPDHVTVIGHERTIARATGRAFECAWVHVFRVADGRIVSFQGLLDSEAAARARAA